MAPSHDAESKQPTFVLDAQQVGCFEAGKFKRGGQQIAIPPTNVEIATESDLKQIYEDVPESKQFSFGKLAQSDAVRVVVDGDRFFAKHIGIVGSTGSGKSCTVAKILQEGIEASEDQKHRSILNNSHIIMFDLHGEYGPAFPMANRLTIDNLVLPYWLMNSEELEEMFLEGREQNFHNQVSQFKHAVILNKKRHNEEISNVNYDTPVYFSLSEVCKFIHNQNRATKDAKTGILSIVSAELLGENEELTEEYVLFGDVTFTDKATGKINGGPYAGEFDRFVSRLDTKVNDDRLAFLLDPKKVNGEPYRTSDLDSIVRQFIGYNSDGAANITILDLSGIPFEVLSIVVSLVSRIVFDFCFHFKKIKADDPELPFLLVFEEAHNYVPQSEGARYSSVKKSIERIAKEGRKYGLSLMIVSQRPSEISETIFSQCNNFVAMRLTNPADQQYIRRLLPDSVSAITDSLPVLEKQEAIVLGDAIAIPSITRVDDITNRPSSQDVAFRTEWKKDWFDVAFASVISQMTKKDMDICLEEAEAPQTASAIS